MTRQANIHFDKTCLKPRYMLQRRGSCHWSCNTHLKRLLPCLWHKETHFPPAWRVTHVDV